MNTKQITGKIYLGFERYATNLHNTQLMQKLQTWEMIAAGIIIGSILSKALEMRIPEKLIFLMGISAILVATNYARQLICKKRKVALLLDSDSNLQIQMDTQQITWLAKNIDQEQISLPIFSGSFRMRAEESETETRYFFEGKPHRSFILFATSNIAAAEQEHYFKVQRIQLQVIPDPVADANTVNILKALHQHHRNKKGV